jgi:pimeloyl-ACP methyl ester carboxylesterase
MPSLKRFWYLTVLVGMAFTAGCCSPLAMLIVSAPNHFNPLAGPANPVPPLESLWADQQVWVRVGPPEAWLSVSILEPKQREPRGTIFVLHGIGARGCTMLPQAKAFVKAGYRAVLVDLRGQGRSTGKYITYGVREAHDLAQVLTAMEAHGRVAGKVGVFGISYGATTSIHWAAIDPRVEAVVAVEPFGMIRPEIPHFGRTLVPVVGWLIPDSKYQSALDEGASIAGFDPDHSDATEAIKKISAPVLLFHGTGDWIVPYWNSEALHAAAPENSELTPIEGGGHASLWFDCGSRISNASIQLYDRALCGALPSEAWAPYTEK